MTVATNSHIEIDDRGKIRIAGHGLPVEYIVAEHLKGLSPSQIQELWPYLTLAELHTALAYYYDHKQQMDADLEAKGREFDRLRVENIAAGRQPTCEQFERWLKERGTSR